MKKLLTSLVLVTLIFNTITADEVNDRVYLNSEEVDLDNDIFRIHQGHNVWIETSTIHRDKTGLFTYNSCISRDCIGKKAQQTMSWKCPYCYRFWPIGTSCQNAGCPSKYK